MKLYWAVYQDSDQWIGPHETVDECREDARAYDFLDAIWVAPVDAETDHEETFWAVVAAAFLCAWPGVNDSLVEDGWIDPDEGWLQTQPRDRKGILARALREVMGPRPAWRTVDTAKAERVDL